MEGRAVGYRYILTMRFSSEKMRGFTSYFTVDEKSESMEIYLRYLANINLNHMHL